MLETKNGTADVVEETTERIETEIVEAPADFTADHETLIAIRAVEREVADSESKWKSAQSVAKMCKEEYELAVDRLRLTIRAAHEPTLFDGKDEDEAAADDETWRDAPIDDLVGCGLKAGIAQLLAEKNITTIGKLADYTSNGYDRLTDIEGIGAGKAEQIDEALQAYWVKHPRKLKPDAQPAANSEPWRDELFSAYIETKKTLNALSNAKLESIGAMEDYFTGGGTLGQIEGLGSKSFTEILAAIDAAKKMEPTTV